MRWQETGKLDVYLPMEYDDGTELTANADVLTHLFDGDLVLTADMLRTVLHQGERSRHRRKFDRLNKRWTTKVPYALNYTGGWRLWQGARDRTR